MDRVKCGDHIKDTLEEYPGLKIFLTKTRDGLYAHKVNEFMGYHLVTAGDKYKASQINIILDKMLGVKNDNP